MKWILILIPFVLSAQTSVKEEVIYDEEVGEIIHRYNLKSGAKHGRQLTLHNGFLHHAETWEYGKLVGPIENYYGMGTLKERYEIDEEGRKHGKHERYYINTRPKEVIYYEHGKPKAGTEVRTWYPNSRIAQIRFYEDCGDMGPADTNMVELGTQATEMSRSGTWSLYTYKGNLYRQITYDCGKAGEIKDFHDAEDTLIYGTNSSQLYYIKKNLFIQQDSTGDPQVIKMKGKFSNYKGIERTMRYKKLVNMRITETFYVSRRYHQETWKTYYGNRRTKSLRIHGFGDYTQQVKTFYPNAQVKEAYKIDLDNQIIGEYTSYWPNGQVMVAGYYLQDSMVKAKVKPVGDDPRLQVKVDIYPSRKSGTWKHYNAKGMLIKEEEY